MLHIQAFCWTTVHVISAFMYVQGAPIKKNPLEKIIMYISKGSTDLNQN